LFYQGPNIGDVWGWGEPGPRGRGAGGEKRFLWRLFGVFQGGSRGRGAPLTYIRHPQGRPEGGGPGGGRGERAITGKRRKPNLGERAIFPKMCLGGGRNLAKKKTLFYGCGKKKTPGGPCRHRKPNEPRGGAKGGWRLKRGPPLGNPRGRGGFRRAEGGGGGRQGGGGPPGVWGGGGAPKTGSKVCRGGRIKSIWRGGFGEFGEGARHVGKGRLFFSPTSGK